MEDFLTKEEIEYIKKTIVSPDLMGAGNPETMRTIIWWNKITMKVLNKTASEEEILQYRRLRALENILTLLDKNIPDDITELVQKDKILDESEKEFLLKVMVENTSYGVEDEFDLSLLKKILEQDCEQDLDEPYIKELIQVLQKDHIKAKEYERMYNTIENVKDDVLTDNVMLSFLFLLYNGLNSDKPHFSIKFLDKKMILYLILKYSSKLNVALGNDSSSKKI